MSRQFGFVKFSDVETATGFVDRNFPSVYLYGNNSSDGDDQGTKVRVAFSRQRDDRERPREDAEWKCGKVENLFGVDGEANSLSAVFRITHVGRSVFGVRLRALVCL